MRARRVCTLLGAGAATIALLLCGTGTAVARPFHVLFPAHFTQPPTTAQCEAAFAIACYGPGQFQQAYNMKPLYRAGLTGRGKTIVIVDAFGSPTIQNDLATFDQDYGLPAPPSLRIIQPAGPVPPFDPTNSDMVGWAEETSLDVEYSHAMAPGANILLVETPVSETEGTVGFPQIVKAENFVINHNLGDVISQSFGATEETFPSAQSIFALRGAYLNAAAHDVTVLGASGDGGATDLTSDTTDYYPFRVNSWPSSDPLVTSVGGTQLHLDANGFRTAPDNVWNDQALFQSPAAGGGGVSAVFSRPFYQNGVAGIVGRSRGTPDVSMSAAVDGGANVYWSFAGAGPPGWTPSAGRVRPRRCSQASWRWPIRPPVIASVCSIRACTRSAIDVDPGSLTSPAATTPSRVPTGPSSRGPSRSSGSTQSPAMTCPAASARPTAGVWSVSSPARFFDRRR